MSIVVDVIVTQDLTQ